LAHTGMQTVLINISDALQDIYHEIASQINFPKF